MKIYGDYHTHSTYSRSIFRRHGKSTILQNAQAAAMRGLNEIAITDHGYGHFSFAMRRSDYDKIKKEVVEASLITGVNVLQGIEANIASTHGDLDLSHDEQQKFDVIVAGVHRAVRKGKGKRLRFWLWPRSKEEHTQIYVRALRNNRIDILSHPGRYMPSDLTEVARVCKETGTLFELNANSNGLTDEQLKELAATGAQFIINSDAHSSSRVGVVDPLLTRCAGIFDKGQIVNTTEGFNWKNFQNR